MKNTTTIAILFVALFITQSCNKYEKLMLVETLTVSGINATGGTATAKIIDVGETGVVSHGWCWSESQNPEISNAKNDLGEINKPSDFSCNINGLVPDKTYYARPYVTGNGETVYGEEIKIETQPLSFDILSPTAGDLLGKTITLTISWTANIDDKLKIELYKNNINELQLGTNLENSGSFNWVVPNTLIDDNDYQIKITSETNEAIDAQTGFFTIISEAPPTVLTEGFNNLSYFTVTVDGRIKNFGTKTEATQHGHCWSIIENPTINGSKTQLGNTNRIGSFSSALTNLQENTTYYVRAYAENEVDINYGEQKTITTLEATEPTVITNAISDINYFTATSGGNVITNNGYAVTERGFCWDVFQNPTVEDNKITNGTGTGVFVGNISNLTANTTYYIRTYAINEIGIAYGEEKSFTTLIATLPTLTTNTVTDITYSAGTCGGDVIDQGDGNITARGVCWSLNQNPTIADNKTIDGSEAGSFISNVRGLSEITTYYVRAYAENSVGVAYGEEKNFKTTEAPEGLIDYDGNVYSVVQIGNQTWMGENLKTTHYANGEAIPLVTDNTVWSNLESTDKAYCYYDNSSSNKDTYGALYTWAAAMNGASSSATNPSNIQGVCPTGWHLPSNVEWVELSDFLGGKSVAGVELKETGTSHWNSPNSETTNSSGFTALPGGYCRYNSYSIGNLGAWWSSTEQPSDFIWFMSLEYDDNRVVHINEYKMGHYGFSVRCLQD